jgi:polysaccharide export outer membrane protein
VSAAGRAGRWLAGPLLGLVLAWGLAAGAQTLPEQAGTAAAPLATPALAMYGAAAAADPVGPGDLLDVRVFGQPQMSGELRVGPDGAIAPPFLARMEVGGDTPAAIEQALQTAYASLLLHPLVSVRVAENNSRRVAVNGAVERPGVYSFSGGLSLMQALGLAGGVDPNKASSKVMIFHAPPPTSRLGANGQMTYTVNEALQTVDIDQIERDPGLNLELRPGDVIEVSEARAVYLSGDVMHPGAERIRPGLTLAQLVSESGGLLPQADGAHVRVLRLEGTTRRELVVDLGKVQRNQAPDLALEPDDIVEVSGSLPRMAGLELLDFFTGTARWRVQQSVANRIP